MKIIALSGPKMAGKSTIANYIEEFTQGEYIVTRCSFAHPLKMVCHILFGGTPMHWFGGDKESVLPEWNLTPRFIMQKVGTNLFRAEPGEGFSGGFGNDFWLRIMRRNLEELADSDAKSDIPLLVIIDDVRFDNEATLISELKGRVYKINVDGENVAPEHASEAGVTGSLFNDIFTAPRKDHKKLQSIAKDIIRDM